MTRCSLRQAIDRLGRVILWRPDPAGTTVGPLDALDVVLQAPGSLWIHLEIGAPNSWPWWGSRDRLEYLVDRITYGVVAQGDVIDWVEAETRVCRDGLGDACPGLLTVVADTLVALGREHCASTVRLLALRGNPATPVISDLITARTSAV